MTAGKTTTVPADTDDDNSDDVDLSEFISHDGDDTVITFRGVKFRFPTSRAKWPTKAMQAFQKRLNADGIELMLGAQQWDLFNTIAPTIADFWEFFPIFAAATKQD